MLKSGLTAGAVLILVLGIVVSCTDRQEEDMESALEQTGETLEAAGEWTAEKAEKLYMEIRDAADGFRRDMEEIKADPPEGEELKEEWNKMVEDLEKRIDRLNEDLDELKNKTGEAWEEMKEDVDRTIEDIEDDIQELRRKN
jgi:chromosome segregation ATPase